MKRYPTRAAAEEYGGEFAGEIERAAFVFRTPDEPAPAELAGYLLDPTPSGTWQVFEHPQDAADPDDLEFIDELRPKQFKSARELGQYLAQLEQPNTAEGDVNAPEVA